MNDALMFKFSKKQKENKAYSIYENYKIIFLPSLSLLNSYPNFFSYTFSNKESYSLNVFVTSSIFNLFDKEKKGNFFFAPILILHSLICSKGGS